jgi:hypothetical protein
MNYIINHNDLGWYVLDNSKQFYINDFDTSWHALKRFKTRAKARDALLRYKGRQFITGWALKDNDLFAIIGSHSFLSLNAKAIFWGQFDKKYEISHEKAISLNPESVRTLERICYYWCCETKEENKSRAVTKDYRTPVGIKYS